MMKKMALIRRPGLDIHVTCLRPGLDTHVTCLGPGLDTHVTCLGPGLDTHVTCLGLGLDTHVTCLVNSCQGILLDFYSDKTTTFSDIGGVLMV